MPGAVARYLDENGPQGRLHLQHGPIDLVIGIDGGPDEGGRSTIDTRQRAFAAAGDRFASVLDELVGELPLLRAPVCSDSPLPHGAVACRMVRAVRPFAGDFFITPMASVAGAVADEIVAAMLHALPEGDRPHRIYVNNGGDIAVHLDGDAEFRVAMAREDGTSFGAFALNGHEPARGVATSGRGGRSLSMGIADSVTIVAANAAAADAAATLVANAVDLPGHPSVERARACDVVDDSDLGDRLVVVDCGALAESEIEDALSRGTALADRLIADGLIERAALFLKRQGRLATRETATIDQPSDTFFKHPATRSLNHA